VASITFLMKQALLIVDVQNFFINKWTQSIPQKIVRLIEANNFPNIVFSKFVNTPESQFVRLFNFTECSKPPYTDIVNDLRPWVKEDNVFTKKTFSVFANPEFDDYLKRYKIEELVIAGLDLEYCVLADAFNAFDKGYKVKLAADCCSSYTFGDRFKAEILAIAKKSIAEII